MTTTRKFCPAFQQIIDDAGVERIVLPPRAPHQDKPWQMNLGPQLLELERQRGRLPPGSQGTPRPRPGSPPRHTRSPTPICTLPFGPSRLGPHGANGPGRPAPDVAVRAPRPRCRAARAASLRGGRRSRQAMALDRASAATAATCRLAPRRVTAVAGPRPRAGARGDGGARIRATIRATPHARGPRFLAALSASQPRRRTGPQTAAPGPCGRLRTISKASAGASRRARAGP